ncbi:hypothetical protein [Oceanibacterium hippocampi]|uniref:Uncharacterized protein n=1 Tax=Oceanibacterium hippocampi TaxID=745714 RepID=A0A1Y5SAU8_9PROT|nr:hypothetical protein [Oceanibacterium hippocampi]SLN35322.1 hypothetical protein OCH7691_01403 [Oceanibacterium hippocampi]
MRKVGPDAAGFAAFTICELLIQRLILDGRLSGAEARDLLEVAALRHEDSAVGDEAALNGDAAYLIRRLVRGLKPLLDRDGAGPAEAPAPAPDRAGIDG